MSSKQLIGILVSIVLAVVVFAFCEHEARIYIHYRGVRNEETVTRFHETPIHDFQDKLDFRLIQLFTMNPFLANAPGYRFDERGFRLDQYNVKFDPEPGLKKIWVLGSSPVQGLGIAENHTLPSYLNAKFVEAGLPWRAVNLANGNYSSVQEFLLLVELLQQGQRPDAIVVVDGVNDGNEQESTEPFFSGWQKDTAKAGFVKDIVTDRPSSAALLRTTLHNMMHIRPAIDGLKSDLHAYLNHLPLDGYPDRYHAGVWLPGMQRYLFSLAAMRGIAKQMGIPIYIFFQPAMEYEVFYKLRKLSDFEQKELVPYMRLNEHVRRETLYSPSLQKLRTTLDGDFFDLYDAFRGVDGVRLYADPRHPGAEGNKILAAKILPHLKLK